MSDDLHRILRRYLRKEKVDPEGGPDAAQWGRLLERLNRSFEQADQDRYTLERSLEISSREMRALHEEVSQDRQRLSAILATLPQAVIDLDSDLQVRFANTLGTALISPVPGMPLEDALVLRDGTGNVMPSSILKMLLTEGAIHETDASVVARGRSFPAAWQLAPVQVDGTILGAVCVVTDLSALKDRELALRQARVEAEVAVRAERTRARFLANMSHELRTPLNAILGYTEMLRDDLADSDAFPEATQDLSRVIRSASYLLNLINDLLDISKVDAGKLELVPELFSLGEVLEHVAATADPSIRAQGNVLRVKSRDAILFQDRTRLTQALLNLLSNAARFTDEGEVRLSVVLFDERLLISIEDTGEGIAEDRLEKIFSEFEQADARVATVRGGTGLGLAITRRFVRLMGGEVRVRSQVGVGSTFTIDIPVDVRGVPPISTVGEGPCVLVVDDDPATHAIVARAASRAGFRVVGAWRPEQAWEFARNTPPDVILLDLTFPGVVSGWDLLSRLRAGSETGEIPVLVFSVVDEAQQRARADVERWLRKPVQSTELVAALRSVTGFEVKPI